MSYAHINLIERTKLEVYLSEGYSIKQIATKLDRHRASIYRELKRNSYRSKPKRTYHLAEPDDIYYLNGKNYRGRDKADLIKEYKISYREQLKQISLKNQYYSSLRAHKKYLRRSRVAHLGKRKILPSSVLEEYILDNLTNYQWSPDQIVATWNKLHTDKLSVTTLYEYIYTHKDKKFLIKHLRRSGKRYRRDRINSTNQRKLVRRSLIPSIHDRDSSIENRVSYGDWEGDTIVGLDRKDRILTHVDRATGIARISLVLAFNSVKISSSTIRDLEPEDVSTITYDNGVEFFDYEHTQYITKSKIYFCDPYSSHQRGTNENFNGLLRDYFPKKYDFKKITKKQLKDIETKLNNRPRKRYNYRTPLEQKLFLESCSS